MIEFKVEQDKCVFTAEGSIITLAADTCVLIEKSLN